MKSPTQLVVAMAAAALALAAAQTAGAQEKYPTKPIRMLVPFSAGSQTDILARWVGEKVWRVAVSRWRTARTKSVAVCRPHVALRSARPEKATQATNPTAPQTKSFSSLRRLMNSSRPVNVP